MLPGLCRKSGDRSKRSCDCSWRSCDCLWRSCDSPEFPDLGTRQWVRLKSSYETVSICLGHLTEPGRQQLRGEVEEEEEEGKVSQ